MVDENILTKTIAEAYLENEDAVDLSMFTSIDDDAAEVFGQYSCSYELDGLTEIGLKTAELMCRGGADISLNNLSEISVEVAEVFVKYKNQLCLYGLKVNPDVARVLANRDVDAGMYLHLADDKVVGESLEILSDIPFIVIE